MKIQYLIFALLAFIAIFQPSVSMPSHVISKRQVTYPPPTDQKNAVNTYVSNTLQVGSPVDGLLARGGPLQAPPSQGTQQ
ncbi:hypothetical protein PVAND_007836 [Polypedilum vanderplanki]|uniref:Secreted protein n=1 Tax=Polypedilum vanderplanki TaxID=319348 RepID=A0A9J6C7X3_POLVA|nr:hypothetical protein PVAND_007836 [Polypedilum vanderplanki]